MIFNIETRPETELSLMEVHVHTHRLRVPPTANTKGW